MVGPFGNVSYKVVDLDDLILYCVLIFYMVFLQNFKVWFVFH